MTPEPTTTIGRRVAAAASIASFVPGAILFAVLILRSLALVFGIVILSGVAAAGAWQCIGHRGRRRWEGLAVALIAVAAEIALLLGHPRLHLLLLPSALLIVSASTARLALTPRRGGLHHGRRIAAPRRAFLIMNPHSGGGKVTQYDLVPRAQALGARVHVLKQGEDVVALATSALRDGADALGVAGGDGTQALVAGVAAAQDVPFIVIAAGTRNHFAMDLGLDRDDPGASLGALTDPDEVRIDVGEIGERTFVNNVSLGIYAAAILTPEYRRAKARTLAAVVPEFVGGDRELDLELTTPDGTIIRAPQTVLVSNNVYDASTLRGFGRRPRLDEGCLGVLVLRLPQDSLAGTIRAVRRAARYRTEAGHASDAGNPGAWSWTTRELLLDSAGGRIAAGVDGEPLEFATPMLLRIRPQALRVLVPHDRPGTGPPPIPLRLSTLRRLVMLAGLPWAPAGRTG